MKKIILLIMVLFLATQVFGWGRFNVTIFKQKWLELTEYLRIDEGGELRFYDVGSSHYTGFEAPALTANQIYVLPAADGTSSQVLITDGSGALGWADAASSAEWTRTGTSLSPTNAGDDIVLTDATIYIMVVSLADDAVHTMPTGIAGHGFVYIGDNQERAEISFEADGTVFLECTSANVIGTDTDGYLCIYDDGSGIEFRNRLGSTLNLTINIVYNTP